MSEANATELALFHPAAHYDSPDEVLDDPQLSDAEKRITCHPGRPTCLRSNPAPACVTFRAWAIRSALPTFSTPCDGSTAMTILRTRKSAGDGGGRAGERKRGGFHRADA